MYFTPLTDGANTPLVKQIVALDFYLEFLPKAFMRQPDATQVQASEAKDDDEEKPRKDRKS